MMGCSSSSCDIPARGGGRKKKYKKSQRGGAHLGLSPASLSSSDSFDRAGNSLANAAHNLYVKQNYELAALKNQNVMMGGGDTDIAFPAGHNTEGRLMGGGNTDFGNLAGHNTRGPDFRGAFGGRKRKYKTAKKYRSKSKSKQQRGGILELGAFINEAAVPLSLLAAQQRYRRGTKGYKGRKSRKFRGSRRRR